MSIGRLILAVIAGGAVWAALWLGGNQLLQATFPEIVIPTERLTHAGILIALMVYSVALSVLAGYVTATIAGANPTRAVWVLAILQLVLGIIAQVSYWNLMPVWYHIPFLALIVPATKYGGGLRAR